MLKKLLATFVWKCWEQYAQSSFGNNIVIFTDIFVWSIYYFSSEVCDLRKRKTLWMCKSYTNGKDKSYFSIVKLQGKEYFLYRWGIILMTTAIEQ